MNPSFEFVAELWEWEGNAAWFFVTLPADLGAEVRELPRMPRGFGSVRVRATVGNSTWLTSIFPEGNSKSYVLPVKKAIRVAEHIDVHELVTISLELLE